MNNSAKNIYNATQLEVSNKLLYYQQWLYDTPLIVKNYEYIQLLKIQKLMYKLISEFINNYSKWKHLLPISKKISNLLSYWNDKPYNIGTYRTDFVYDKNNTPRIIEITCRFAMNGYFCIIYF